MSVDMFTKGQIFQHKDGGIYQLIQVARYSDRPGEAVVYLHVWPFDRGMWVRPTEEWTEDRFKPITPQESSDFIYPMSQEEAQAFVKANKAARK